jgi:hypothetical protein
MMKGHDRESAWSTPSQNSAKGSVKVGILVVSMSVGTI